MPVEYSSTAFSPRISQRTLSLSHQPLKPLHKLTMRLHVRPHYLLAPRLKQMQLIILSNELCPIVPHRIPNRVRVPLKNRKIILPRCHHIKFISINREFRRRNIIEQIKVNRAPKNHPKQRRQTPPHTPICPSIRFHIHALIHFHS